MRSDVRVGGIGCGNIFNEGHLPAYAAFSSDDIVAFYDIDKAATERTRDHYFDLLKDAGRESTIPPEGMVCSSVEELLKKVNVVDICTSLRYHAYYADLALRRGIHVMSEKPMARTWWEANCVASASNGSQALYQLNDDNLFIPRYQALKNVMESGMIGEIQSLWIARGSASSNRARWFFDPIEAGGGAVMDYGSHAVAAAWFLLGYDLLPVEVKSLGIRVKDRTRVVDGQLCSIHIDDDAHFKVRFQNPKTGDWADAVIEATWSWPDLFPNGTDVNGYIEAQGSIGTATVCYEDERDFIRVSLRNFGERIIPVRAIASERESFEGEIKSFFRSIYTHSQPMLNATIGAEITAILNSAQLSELRGRHSVTLESLKEFSSKLAKATEDPWKGADLIVRELTTPYLGE